MVTNHYISNKVENTIVDFYFFGVYNTNERKLEVFGMYPKRKPKSDRERFVDAFKKKVGASPEAYLQRKLLSGMDERELKKLYDMLAIEIAQKARCTAVKYDMLMLEGKNAKKL